MIGQQAGDVGRATKYEPDFCLVVRELAQRGEFPEAWAAEMGVTLNTMRNWSRSYPDFAEAVVIAHHLLQTYWTRDIVANRMNPNARLGLYGLIARRLPALYGRNPVDLVSWLVEPEKQGEGAASTLLPMIMDIRSMTDQEISTRIEVLRARRLAARQP
jgi:hypothetical protein